MSSAAAWANTQSLTLWRKGATDLYGRITYGSPEVMLCSYKIGGSKSYNDQNGDEFIPAITYYTELKTSDGDYLDAPNFGDKLALGEFTGDPTDDAADIRMITAYDAQMFGSSEMPDYMIGV